MDNNSIHKRIGNFEFREVYPLVRNWEKRDPYYEIVKYYPNPHYGKESEYDLKDGEFYLKSGNPYHRVHQSCFENPEGCYTVATFVYDSHEPCWDLKSIGSRITDCDNITELQELFSVIQYGFDTLNKKLADDE